MALAADGFLSGVVATRLGRWRFHRLAVGDAGRGACLAAHALAVDDQSDVMDGAEQEQPDEPPEPPVNRLPRREVRRAPIPASSGPSGSASRAGIGAWIAFHDGVRLH
jgi:hypothetical protein